MAIKSKRKGKKKKKEGNLQDPINFPGIERELEEAGNTYTNLGWGDALPTLDPTLPADQQNQIARFGVMTDPLSPGFIGSRSQETKDILGKLASGMDGLTAAENQGMREQAQREVDRQYQGALRNLATQQARSGVRGASATAQNINTERARGQQQSELEQDIMLKNIDIQDRRRGAYADYLAGTEASEFGRRMDAEGMYGDLMANRNEYTQGINRFNIGQAEKDKLGRIAGTLGLSNLRSTRRYGRRQEKLAKEGRKSGGNTASNNTGSDNTSTSDPGQDYLATLTGLYNDRYGV